MTDRDPLRALGPWLTHYHDCAFLPRASKPCSCGLADVIAELRRFREGQQGIPEGLAAAVREFLAAWDVDDTDSSLDSMDKHAIYRRTDDAMAAMRVALSGQPVAPSVTAGDVEALDRFMAERDGEKDFTGLLPEDYAAAAIWMTQRLASRGGQPEVKS